MSIADGADIRVTYKAYATGAITSNSQPTSSSDPGVGSAQVLRRVASTLSLQKDTYQSAEIRNDRQVVDMRHGVKRVTGSLQGEYSPGTWSDFFQAISRGTWSSVVTASQSDFTSVSADNTTSVFTFTAGNPVTKGLRVGMIIRFASLSDSDNNSKNFVITGFGGTQNRTVSVYPAPDTMTLDTSFSLTSVKYLFNPSSSLVSRKFAVEHYYEDNDFHQLFTECRVGSCNIALPATGMATVEFGLMGRDMETASGGSSPFFTSPTAPTTTGIFQAVNGLLKVSGTTVGLVTGLTININLNPSAEPVVGQNFVPEIFLGRTIVTGQVTVLLEDSTFLSYFKDETEISILAYLTTTSAIAAAANTIFLPRVKFTGADIPASGEGAQIVTMPFAAIKSVALAATAGVEPCSFFMSDTEVA